MSKIGILAYGSLIEDPGVELGPLISESIFDVETPFNIEFARSSRTRDEAPTVVPVDRLGAPAQGVILVLNEEVTIGMAKDLLWRRETRNEGSSRPYRNPVTLSNPFPDRVVIVEVEDLAGIDIVLYTRIHANIVSPTPEKLARLAIKSATGNAGSEGKDGISYLISLKRQQIETPLMAQYEAEILNTVGASSLQDALRLVRMHSINSCQ